MPQQTVKTKLLQELQNIQIKFSGKVARSSAETLSALIIPPANLPGGLGDDAMLTAASSYLHQQGFSRIAMLSFDTSADWSSFEYITDSIQIGSIPEKLNLVSALKQFTHVFCVGADMIDGFYSDGATCRRLRLIEMAAQLGIQATVLGASFNETPTPAAIQSLRQLPSTVHLCCRDAISQERLAKAANRPVELVTDVAFLLSPDNDSEIVSNVVTWVKQQQAAGQIVVGFNAKKLYSGEGPKQTEAELAEIFSQAIIEILEQRPDVSILMLPHDSRGISNDVTLATQISNLLPSELSGRHSQIPMPCRAADIKGIVRHVDFVLTGRMHLAIASLGQGTPVGCVTYQGKFEGLFQHFLMDGVTLPPEEAVKEGCLSAFLLKLLPQRQNLAEQVSARLPHIKTMSQKNFKLVTSPVTNEAA